MASKDVISRAPGAIERDSRQRYGRLGALLLGVASALSIPAGLAIDPPPETLKHLVGLTGVVLSFALFVVPWQRLAPRALYVIPVIGTIEVVLGVVAVSDDFAFYQVLIAIWTAYVVDDRRDFTLLMAFFTASIIAPLVIGMNDHTEQLHHVLVNLPVLLIAAGVVRYLRDALTEREREYRRFAEEAISLADRIRGPGTDDGEHRDLGLQLDELAGRSRSRQLN